MKFFSDGIRNSASEVGKSIGQVMDWVKGFFPHSPALRGPLSGSGWTEIGSAGTAIATSFAGGLSGGTGLVGSASDTLMRAVAMPKVNNYRLGGATGAASPLAPTSITNNNTVYEAVSARATAIEMVRLQAVGV